MVTLEPVMVTPDVAARIRFAARASGVAESIIVGSAVAALSLPEVPPPGDPWDDLDVHAVYEGQRVEGRYLPATGRLVVTTGPLAGRSFKSPSGAARAVIAAVKPTRTSTTNGWRFWRVTVNDARLDHYRSSRRTPRPPDILTGEPGRP